MTGEEFTAWREHPVTKWVMKALETGAELQRESWINESWNKNNCNKFNLMELRNKADVFSQIAGASYEDFCAFNGEEPSYDE